MFYLTQLILHLIKNLGLHICFCEQNTGANFLHMPCEFYMLKKKKLDAVNKVFFLSKHLVSTKNKIFQGLILARYFVLGYVYGSTNTMSGKI